MNAIKILCCVIAAGVCSCTPRTGEKRLPDGFILHGFESQQTLTDAHFRGISVVDSLVVWISGSRGTYLRTVDGGSTWKVDTIQGYTAFDFRDIEAFDANRAVIMGIGRPAVILKTLDGGSNWSICYLDEREGVFLNSMAFWNDFDGIAVGDPLDERFHIICTEDGGESWKEIPFENRPKGIEGEYQFAASGTCVTVIDDDLVYFGTGGKAARIYHSRDKGNTWQISATPAISGLASTGIFSVHFAGKDSGWAVGGDYTKESEAERNAIISFDGGEIWNLAHRLPTGFRSSILEFTGAGVKILLCTGPSGTDYSVDRGITWIPLDTLGYHTMDSGRDGKTVWAAGANGRIGKLIYGFCL